MVSTLAPLVALLISIFTLMLGNGLINILLPVRMRLDGVETDTIGLVLSLYAVALGLDFPLKSAAGEGEIAGGRVGSPMCLRIALIEAVAVPAGEWGNFEQ